jgi:site-specific recombinase XerC
MVWLLRDLEPEEIAGWTARMRVRGQDARVLERALVVGRRLLDRIARGPSEAELYDLAAGEPLEAVLAAMALDDTGIAADRLVHFLDVTRHVSLSIGGRDLISLGFSSGPRMGEVLRSVLHLKLNGVVTTRDEELAAAARMQETA